MSTSVDFEITSVENDKDIDDLVSLRETTCSSRVNTDESNRNSGDSADSGMVLNFSSSFRNNLNKPVQPNPHIIKNTRGNLLAKPGAHLCDLRRPSIVDMVNSGGLFINQRGSFEINLENVDPTELEQFYADSHLGQRRGSCVGSGNGYPGKEELYEASLIQKKSISGSSEHLESESSGCMKTSKYWWSPNFNSEVLEKQLKKTVVEFLRTRLRVALVSIGMCTLLWIVIFSANIPFEPTIGNSSVQTQSNQLAIYSVRYTEGYVFGPLILLACIGVLLVITFTDIYAKFAVCLSVIFSVILMLASFSLAVALKYNQGFLTMSFVAQFAITAVFILVIFTLSRLPMWLSVVLSILYLFILECVVGVITFYPSNTSPLIPQRVYISSTLGRILLYIGLILAGLTTAYLLQVRQLATFWKIAQCVLSQKALDLERELEEKTILSMMPKNFADNLLSVHVQMAFMIKRRAVQESEGSLDPAYQSISAPFNICNVDNVTILFADIVEFTKFSSSLSANELVGILNDVFCKFDEFVTTLKCEKISTLGDCYFCVSGCPEPEPKHADNCVNMGLAIVEALEEYRKKNKWKIQMRVGIHTGSVFCGVMGAKRFKFDVWSRDVRMANRIESISTPGRVLISRSTYSCLKGVYNVVQANITKNEPELANMDVFYVTACQKTRPHYAAGLSGLEWKKKINTIDTVHKPDQISRNRKVSIASLKSANKLLCPWWPKKEASDPVRKKIGEGYSSTSIVDIQAQLRRCTSYADLAVPMGEEENKSTEDMDEVIVKYMEDHKVHFDTYFDPQLQLLSLNFRDRDWESTYRKYGRDLDDGLNGELTEMELGYRITKLSYMLDTSALFVSYLLIMLGSAVCLTSDDTFKNIWVAWLAIFIGGLIVEIPILIFVFAVFAPHRFPERFAKFATKIINWYVRSCVALFFIYYPMTIIGVSVTQCSIYNTEDSEAGLAHVQLTFFITIVVLVSSFTFMEVSYIVKFVGGILSALLTVVIVMASSLTCINTLPSLSIPLSNLSAATTTLPNSTRPIQSDPPLSSYFSTYYSRHVAPEAVILLLLVLILLTVVNRMSEVSVRLSFIGRIEASARRRLTQQRKVQAEWLLFNIIPPHVAYKLRTTGKYSQNHECAGVMFASIVNFQQFLQNDENKGEDSLRLLNVIISEFDTLLERQQFVGVEKIKTIGSTYMVASGLNLCPEEECDSVSYLLDLVELGHHLMDVLEHINNTKVTGFVFTMHIGFNYGPVTSGVVGSQKMLYDIWGDTVNVASRMDSTGAINKIHMPHSCLEKLGPHVKYTTNKVINVKGKGEMETVFVTRH